MSETAQSIAPQDSVTLPGALPGVTPADARARARALAERVWFPDTLGVIGVLLVTALLAWHRLWLENGLAYLDVATFYMPWYAHLGEAVRALDIPGWNPYVFSGTPFAGDPQSGWWYFPAMAIFSLFEPVRAYQIFLIFHLAFAGVTTYILCRMYGLQVIPSLAAGAAYQSGPFVSHVSCCLIHVQLATWIPMALIGVETTVRSKHTNRRAIGWVITGFSMSQMIAGWPGQGMYNGCLLTGAYLAFRILLSRENGVLGARDRLVRLVGDSAGVLTFALLWAAGGLLPRMDIVSRTNVAWGEYDGFETNSYASGWQVYTVLDRLFTDNNGYRSMLFYLGTPVIILMIIGVVLAWRKPWVQFMTGVTILTSIMTLKPTFIHEIVFLLPRYEALHSHVPSRILAVQWIAPVVLAATALDTLMHSPARDRILRAVGIAFGIWTGVALLLQVGNRPVPGAMVVAAVMTAGIVCLFAIVTTPPSDRYSRFVPRAQAGLAILLMLLVIGDPAGRRLVSTLETGQTMSEVIRIPTGPVSRQAVPENDATTDPGGAGEFLQEKRDAGEYFRYFGYDNVLQQGGESYPSTYRENFGNPTAIAILVNARAMRLHLNDVQGYNPVQLKNYVTYLNQLNDAVQNYHDAQILPDGLNSPLLNILNARYIIIPNEAVGQRPRADIMLLLASYPEVFRNDTVRILENPHAMPRAWIAHRVVQAQPELAAGMIATPGFDPAETVILSPAAGTVVTAKPANPQAESVQIVAYEPDRVVLKVHADADGVLVLSESYEEGWHAHVDGDKAPVDEAYGVVRAVPITAGDHTVVLTYDPWSLRYGFYLSLLGAALSLAVIGAFAVRRMRGGALEVDS
ncbi:MAG TPA: YfhO family protein [Thermomicrobiales bacterium]|nr:YfhO family protein [Thermomicrobiales bacterium]